MSSETSSLQENEVLSDSSEEPQELFSSMQKLMMDMLEEVDESIETLYSLEKDLHHSQDLYESLHFQKALEPYLTIWKKENRLFENGFSVQLTEEEQKVFGFESKHVSIYDICFSFLLKKTEKTV